MTRAWIANGTVMPRSASASATGRDTPRPVKVPSSICPPCWPAAFRAAVSVEISNPRRTGHGTKKRQTSRGLRTIRRLLNRSVAALSAGTTCTQEETRFRPPRSVRYRAGVGVHIDNEALTRLLDERIAATLPTFWPTKGWAWDVRSPSVGQPLARRRPLPRRAPARAGDRGARRVDQRGARRLLRRTSARTPASRTAAGSRPTATCFASGTGGCRSRTPTTGGGRPSCRRSRSRLSSRRTTASCRLAAVPHFDLPLDELREYRSATDRARRPRRLLGGRDP